MPSIAHATAPETATAVTRSHTSTYSVLHVIHRSGIGGLERLLLDYLAHARPESQQLLVLNSAGPLHEDFSRLVPVHMPERPGGWRSMWYAFHTFRRYRNSIIHLHLTGPLYIVLAWLAGCRLLIDHVHGIALHPSRKWRILERVLWWLARSMLTAHIAPSQMVRSTILDRRMFEHKIRVIYNGVDFSRFSMPTSTDQFASIPAGAPVVTFIGRFEEVKNLRLWVRSAALLAHTHPDVHFVLAGSGAMEAPLQADVDALGLANRVTFIVPCLNVPALLARTSIFMSLSTRETFGLSVIEALAASVPVLVHDIPVFRELLLPAAPQFLVTADTPETVAAALERMLAQHEEARALAAEVRRQLARDIDIPSYSRNIDALYREITSASGSIPAV